MFGLGPHWEFIVGAWIFAVALIGGLIVWVIADHRAQRRTLAQLEQEGHGRPDRRSAP